MTELTARLMVVSEAENDAYMSLQRDESNAYQQYVEMEKSGKRPLWHWQDWQRLSECCRKPYWDEKIRIETRHQLIQEFEQKCIKVLYGKMISDYERNEGWSNEAARQQVLADINIGWLLDAHICHKIDSIIRGACISISKPNFAGGFASRLGKGATND